MVKCLEMLSYDVEDIGFGSWYSQPATEKTLCLPNSKWVPILNQGRIRQQTKACICCAQDIASL